MSIPSHYIVSIVDLVNARMAGRYGGYYVSPPQPRAKAYALIRTWLGDSFDHSRTAWSVGIPYGRRIVTLTEAHDAPDDASLHLRVLAGNDT